MSHMWLPTADLLPQPSATPATPLHYTQHISARTLLLSITRPVCLQQLWDPVAGTEAAWELSQILSLARWMFLLHTKWKGWNVSTGIFCLHFRHQKSHVSERLSERNGNGGVQCHQCASGWPHLYISRKGLRANMSRSHVTATTFHRYLGGDHSLAC